VTIEKFIKKKKRNTKTMMTYSNRLRELLKDYTPDKEHLVVELFEELRKNQNIDPLTGALNRRLFEEMFVPHIERAAFKQGDGKNLQPIALMYLDVDNFREINKNRKGYQNRKDELHFYQDAGDHLLQDMVTIMRESTRPEDIIGRDGGDEFIIGLPGAGITQAVHSAERILTNIREETGQTVSIGVTACPNPTTRYDLTHMVKHANEAFRVSKESGKNRYEIWTPTLKTRSA
jgi:diguanylate cyclase (GGDEF)-like protein